MNNCIFKKSFNLFTVLTIVLLVYACTKPGSPVTPPPIPPVVPPPTVVKPTDVWFELDSIAYNFLKNAADSTTTVRFIAHAKGATGYKWDFGDGETYPTDGTYHPAKDSIIKHTYKRTSPNKIYLYAKNDGGETSSLVKDTTINVYNGGIELVMDPLHSALFYNLNILETSIGSIEVKQGSEQKLLSTSFLTQASVGTSVGALFFNSPAANIQMFPNVLFNFILQKKSTATPVNAGQYNDVTAKHIWDNLPETSDDDKGSKTNLLKGETKKIRILKTAPTAPDNVQLYFFGRLLLKK